MRPLEADFTFSDKELLEIFKQYFLSSMTPANDILQKLYSIAEKEK